MAARLASRVPIGFRAQLAGVRNAQLQLARERAILQDQELEVSHQLASAIRDLDRSYRLTETNFNRRIAAEVNVQAVRAAYDTDTVTLDLLLDAQRRLAEAESDYFRSLVDYNLAIRTVHLRKGSLLEYNNVYLAEGPWPGKAYFDAHKRARERERRLPGELRLHAAQRLQPRPDQSEGQRSGSDDLQPATDAARRSRNRKPAPAAPAGKSFGPADCQPPTRAGSVSNQPAAPTLAAPAAGNNLAYDWGANERRQSDSGSGASPARAERRAWPDPARLPHAVRLLHHVDTRLLDEANSAYPTAGANRPAAGR